MYALKTNKSGKPKKGLGNGNNGGSPNLLNSSKVSSNNSEERKQTIEQQLS